MQTQSFAGASGAYEAMLGLSASLDPKRWSRSLRAETEAEIDRLISLLDAIDGDADLEPDLAGYQPDAADDREDDNDLEPYLAGSAGEFIATGQIEYDLEYDLCDKGETFCWSDEEAASGSYFPSGHWDDEDSDHGEEGGDDEPLLGRTEHIDQELSGQAEGWICDGGEPSLGWTGCGIGVSSDIDSPRDDREDDAGDNPEMEDEHGGNILDEPHDAIGWTEDEAATGEYSNDGDPNNDGVADEAGLDEVRDQEAFSENFRHRTAEQHRTLGDLHWRARQMVYRRQVIGIPMREPARVAVFGPDGGMYLVRRV